MGLKLNKRLLTVIAVIAALILLSAWMIHASTDKVDFTTQVKPIINQHCITCHGGVRKKGGFSLMFRDEALAKTKDSIYAIIPGDPDNSELMRRITLKDPVDNFIEQKLKEEKLEHSSQADKATLIRRVSFDITGMQPPANIAQKFLNDSSNHAYEELVDSLLASQHYGEKWAGMWLDLA